MTAIPEGQLIAATDPGTRPPGYPVSRPGPCSACCCWPEPGSRSWLRRPAGRARGRPDTFATRTRTDGEVLLGTGEGHLSFRASVLIQADHVVLSTVVQVHNRRGRAYSAVVRRLHPPVVRAVLGRAARSLSATQQGVLVTFSPPRWPEAGVGAVLI